jgi:predicted DNA-binding transcriptional regulator AlpA
LQQGHNQSQPTPPVTNQNLQRPRRLIGVKQVAQMIGQSEAWVRDHCGRREPRLPVRRIARKGGKGPLKFYEDEIEQFIEAFRS